MKAFLAHNYYQNPGGEDGAFTMDANLLEARGHKVYRYVAHNDDIKQMGRMQVVRATFWNDQTYRNLRNVFDGGDYAVAHFHNTFPMISPSAYYAARDSGIPVVQTLHNFRLICPNAILYRDGHICEDCVGKVFALPSLAHNCYRDSRSQTGVVALLNTIHHLRGTWFTQVDRYIALTEFARCKFIEAGFPPNKIVVRPNFLEDDPGVRQDFGDYALYVGRLTPEKGVRTLLEAWRHLPNVPLKIIGDGPLKEEVLSAIKQHGLNIELLGWRASEEVIRGIKGARFLLFPSEWYETFGRVVIEAFACGTPVIASNLGAPAETVEHLNTGLHFEAGNAEDMVEAVLQLWSRPELADKLGQGARKEYELKYTADRAYECLLRIYESIAEQT